MSSARCGLPHQGWTSCFVSSGFLAEVSWKKADFFPLNYHFYLDVNFLNFTLMFFFPILFHSAEAFYILKIRLAFSEQEVQVTSPVYGSSHSLSY